ncbi:RNA polymerase sigma factor [Camelliibacillus cellulosilyticus]|uniref:RNA polymerase sigma factor n=1 Tax=Camelliibacillus cellulosilyticus TaxID=2174486 RepID=A0ABV9GME7_9BACL
MSKGRSVVVEPHRRSIETFVNDRDLVERAKKNDPDAFGELVSRHRAKAYGWAQKISKDPYLAEDIVQDALLQAYLQIGQLIDETKFMSWFYRIVANQSYMRLRRGGNFAKEKPLASFTKEGEMVEIDQILFRLSESAYYAATDCPVEWLLRKETITGIKGLLHCLTDRERAIFEKFFFEQLSPQEMANLFGYKISNVYNLISRSRAKVQLEHIRASIRDYIKTREEDGLPKKCILDHTKIKFGE